MKIIVFYYISRKSIRISGKSVHTFSLFSFIFDTCNKGGMPVERYHDLPEILKAIRISRHQSLARFSKEVGISKSTLQQIEHGNGTSLDTLVCIARHLDIPVAALLSRDVPPQQWGIFLQILSGLERFASLPQEQQVKLSKNIVEITQILAPDVSGEAP